MHFCFPFMFLSSKKRKTYKDKKKTRLKSVFTKKLKRNEKFIQNSYQNGKNFKHMQPNI